MASRWHRRTAIAIGVVATICAVIVAGRIALDAIAQARKEKQLIGKWVVREAIGADVGEDDRWTFDFRDDETWSFLMDSATLFRRERFEVAGDRLILSQNGAEAESFESSWEWSFEDDGALVLDGTDLDGETVRYRLRRSTDVATRDAE